MKVVSVSSLIRIGLANFPTTNNSFASLYNPIVVTYGLKFEPVAKFASSSVSLVCSFLVVKLLV